MTFSGFLSRFLVVVTLLLSAGLTSMLLAQTSIPPGTSAEKVVGGFQFVEGPVWKTGYGLIFSDMNFSDMTKGKVHHWSADSGARVLVYPAGGADGLVWDGQGRVISARQGARDVVRFTPGVRTDTLARTFRGKRLNSPNDLTWKSDSSIFFTDPPYGLTNSNVQNGELKFCGIYRMTLDGQLTLLDSTLGYPNGIAFSPDEHLLYVSDAKVNLIYVWDVVNDSTIANRRVFVTLPSGLYTDGLKVDPSGNLFATVAPQTTTTDTVGVWVYNPAGVRLGKIRTAETPSNCAWGDDDRRTLFITARTSLYRYRLPATGVEGSWEGPAGAKLGLESCSAYPNPFNATVTVRYTLRARLDVQVIVSDILGRTLEVIEQRAQEPGAHELRFDAANWASGVYFCRVEAGRASATVRMLLVR